MSQENTPSDQIRRGSRGAARYVAYWLKIILQPMIAVLFVIVLAWLFGYLQRNRGWFDGRTTAEIQNEVTHRAQYACSMLCVFVGAPGRCPVCGMQLQKIEAAGDPKDLYGVTIAPAARRLANISTVAALNVPVTQEHDVVGRVEYDETKVSVVSAYVDGRVEDLLVDYTGARVQRGDAIAVVYSPDLYSDQVSLIQAHADSQKTTGNERIDSTNRRLYESARRRLIEQGLPESDVDAIVSRAKAENRVRIYAPISGTVVHRLVEEGKYIEAGMPILKLADLSTVWLMLEMFPEDASNLKIGQSATVELQAQVGRSFEGKVSFIEPFVDTKTRTVKVRVVLPNESGLIKVGDLARAKIRSDVGGGEQLVVVPREAVLVSGSTSIAYVETEPGRFEFRNVKVAKMLGDRVAIADGIRPGELVVSSGAFMLDSAFSMQGKVSLIDPKRATPKDQALLANEIAEAREIELSFADLTAADRSLAELQVICPVTEVKLGTMGMGIPIRVDVNGTPVMICCEGCRKALLNDPEEHFEILRRFQSASLDPNASGMTQGVGEQSARELWGPFVEDPE